ncbi:MAG TPA: FAD-dependent oxidoreductase [Terriglobales bacterium]|jgi:2-polyprenyl-6-methoxyphenol hydroxylase-like FAD-dependent oxidoreductase|nr:FAD-dependent oxidoreductase [Terriglobales bacterium]
MAPQDPPSPLQSIEARCCVAGGGPAGIMIGFLLARAGVDVVVLEKHSDFLRDFRGDTVHPSTLELMCELGIIDEFLRRPHQELRQIGALIEDFSVTVADFSHLPTHCKFVALMPQWDFLNFITEKAKLYPQFHLRMEAEVTDLLIEDGRVTGVRAKTLQGTVEVRAQLTIGADGRHSKVREAAQLEVIDLGAPIDVLWMRLAKRPGDPSQTLGRFREGKILVTLDRDDYWQCAYVIQKGEFDSIQQKGLPAFRENIESAAPFFRGRIDELKSWDDIKLLSVAVDRLRHWSRTGLLCIGDSAHAMSPIGGVGINLAIQDAVAAANILAQPLLQSAVSEQALRAVQERREFPTRMTQRLQVFVHKNFIGSAMNRRGPLRRLPLPLKLLQHFPVLRRIPARMIGLGFRPEHIHSGVKGA